MVLGAVDCTHVAITGPLGEHEGDFVNRKSYHSINVQENYVILIFVRSLVAHCMQMTCDHQLMVSGSPHLAASLKKGVLMACWLETEDTPVSII